MNEPQYSLEMFKPHIGESFSAKLPDDSLPLVLKEVEPLLQAEGMVQFSIVFHGPRSQFLRQQMYELEHPALGTLAIFLVPIGETKDVFVYQAVFCRTNGSKTT